MTQLLSSLPWPDPWTFRLSSISSRVHYYFFKNLLQHHRLVFYIAWCKSEIASWEGKRHNIKWPLFTKEIQQVSFELKFYFAKWILPYLSELVKTKQKLTLQRIPMHAKTIKRGRKFSFSPARTVNSSVVTLSNLFPNLVRLAD